VQHGVRHDIIISHANDKTNAHNTIVHVGFREPLKVAEQSGVTLEGLLVWLSVIKELMAVPRTSWRSVVFFNASTIFVKVRGTCPQIYAFTNTLTHDHLTTKLRRNLNDRVVGVGVKSKHLKALRLKLQPVLQVLRVHSVL
jgi:hypothetical protein